MRADAHSSTKRERRTFATWLKAQGAEVLQVCDWEFARFRAHGFLCIVHENKKGWKKASGLAQEALSAWEAEREIDLSNPPPEPEVEDWHAVGRAGSAVAERVRAGEIVDMEREASAIGIAPDRLHRILVAHRAIRPALVASEQGAA